MSRLRTGLVAGSAATLLLTAGVPATAAPITYRTLTRVDLATVGTGGTALDINGRGQILGYLPDATAPGGIRPVLWTDYRNPTDLGRPGDYPYDLNNRGDVLGDAWIWSNGRLSPLEHPSLSVRAVDINDRRQVVGQLESTTTFDTHAFRWQNGRFTDLGAPEGLMARADAVNNQGTVLGTVFNALDPPSGAFVWRDGVMTVFGTELASITPKKINDRGQVLLWGGPVIDSYIHPYVWQHGTMIDLLADRPNASGFGNDINNAGDVVGMKDDRPVLWRNGRTIQLVPPGWTGNALSINERGDIAGGVGIRTGETTENRVFLWRNGRIYLSEPATEPLSFAYAVGVDEHGTVAGMRNDPTTGDRYPVAWIPSGRRPR
jgi:probable HAF family extracellular repeat protein